MKDTMKKFVAFIMLISILIGIVRIPVSAGSVVFSDESGISVSSREEFMAALQNHQSPILVHGLITIGQEAEEGGRMLPVKIPAGTVIRGVDENSILNNRAPIQLEGDGVVFSNLKLHFESSDALGSVPHREIFLAGHSLTMDHVDTYLDGSGNLGGFGGTEEELLPTVYAGGFTGSSIGSNASLTVQNSIEKTMFKGIYMGHNEGTDQKVPYTGTSFLQLDAPVIVREGIFTDANSEAEIQITDSREGRAAKADKFYGNENTALHISKCSVLNAVVENIGSVVLDNGGHLDLKTASLQDVSVKNRACLDFHQVSDAVINGNFEGQLIENESQNEQMGTLVLNREGQLDIRGTVSGVTRFQTDNRSIPGVFYDKWPYITENNGGSNESHFVLPQGKIEDGYTLEYENGAWTLHAPDLGYEYIEIGSIEVVSKPDTVDISAITMKDENDLVPDESVFCNIIWYDIQGNRISSYDVEEYLFYYNLVVIKTEFLQSEDESVLEDTNWSNSVYFSTSENNPDNYYLYAAENTKSGDYTFMLFPDYVDGLVTVADVKALKDTAKASFRVVFYDSSKGETPPVHQHDYTSQVTKEATCSEEGVRTYTCEGCGDSYTEVIEKTAHTEVIDAAEAASCTKDGKTEGSHCSECGFVIQVQQIIPKKEHTYEEEITKPSTCTEEGIKTLTCTACGDEKTEVIETVAHTEVIDAAEAASCTKEGKTEGSHCGECGYVIKVQQIIPKTKHTYEEEITKPSTCTEEGIKTLTCTVCGDEKTEAIATIAHTEVTDAAEAASCTKEGKTEGSHCGVCGYVIKAQQIIPKTEHTYEEEITKPSTCTEEGIKTLTCTVCGDEKTEAIEKTDHTYEEEITKPSTCTEEGIKTLTCTVCGDEKTESIATIAHTEVTDAAEAASCIKEGKTEGSHCGVCGYVIKAQQIIPKTEHTYEEEITKPSTCAEEGIKTLTCTVCGDEKTEAIEKVAHTEVIDAAEAASCIKEGKTEGSHCSECGYVIKAQQIIPKTEHTYEEEITKPSTCTEEGIKTLTCTVCGDEKTESIATIAHTEVTDAAVSASCTRSGKTQGSHCSVCKKVIRVQNVIPMTAHQYQTKITKALVNKNGASIKSCIKCGSVLKRDIIYSPKTVELSSENYVYNGKEQKPDVVVKDSIGKVIGGRYYTVSYQGNKNTGIAEVKISFKDNYSGTLSKSFTIRPKSTGITKLEVKSNRLNLKWKKQKKQISGYEIQYSANKAFQGKTTKSILVKRASVSSKQIKKLKSGKKYYFRICTYKSVKVNGKTTRIPSDWSKVKVSKKIKAGG